MVCPASLVLPAPERERSESSQKAIDWGTLCHHWKETGDTSPIWASPADIKCLEKKLVMSGVEREDWWPPGPGRHEVTFAVELRAIESDPDGALLMLHSAAVDKDAWKRGFDPIRFLTGTIDWLDDGWVDDLKTGHWHVDEKSSKQLLSYSVVPWILESMASPHWAGTVSITQWERYPLHGQPQRREHAVTGLDIYDHVQDLIYAADHPEETNPTDEGCKFCDCRPNCPEWQMAVSA